MRVSGIIKVLIALILDFVLVYHFFGIEVASLVTIGITLYAWIGEYIALMRDGAIKLNNLNSYERTKLERSFSLLEEGIKKHSNVDVNKIKLYVLPTEQINAFAYGIKSIGITRGVLNCCDELTLSAVMSHEISHILSLDAVFSRIVFANITLLIIGLIVASFATVAFLWMIFILLCFLGICGGYVSVFFFSASTKVIKGIFSLAQRSILFIYQAIMGIVSRKCEYRADNYAVQLGYGAQLNYFLERFVANEEGRQKSISEIIYDTHPSTYKRIQRIEQRR